MNNLIDRIDRLWARPWFPFALVLIGAAALWSMGYIARDTTPDVISKLGYQPKVSSNAVFWMAMLVVAVGAFAPYLFAKLRKRKFTPRVVDDPRKRH